MENKDLLKDIQQALDVDSQCEVFLRYKDFLFFLEPHGKKIEVKSCGKVLGRYNSFEEMINNFTLEGKSFVERISEIEYE